MKGRSLKLFLPIFTGLLVLSGLFISQPVLATQTGSITVCKIIADGTGLLVDGSQFPAASFSISGITPAQNTGDPAVGQIGTSNFNSPLSFNADLFASTTGNDAQCTTYPNLTIGSYYYGEETITGSGWASPKYNDQHTVQAASLSDFYNYDNNLFDGNIGNDPSRNTNSDGNIILTADRPTRTLIVLNQKSSQPVGGGNPTVNSSTPSGAIAPACPVISPQKPDKVWFDNIQNGSVTVHWVNKGDAQGYQIAYGFNPNQWLWGTKVGNVSEVTLNNLPAGNIWVTVIPLGTNDCPGSQSDPAQAVGPAGDKPKVLAATGFGNSIALLLSGLSFISLGLFQTTKTFKKKK